MPRKRFSDLDRATMSSELRQRAAASTLIMRLQAAESELLALPKDAPRVELDKASILALVQDCLRQLTVH